MNKVVAYMHCGQCLDEMPDGVSPREWGKVEVGWTNKGFQVWCKRHERNVIHMDFEGQQHPTVFEDGEVVGIKQTGDQHE